MGGHFQSLILGVLAFVLLPGNAVRGQESAAPSAGVGLSLSYSASRAIRVSDLLSGGAADLAQVHIGDELISIDGRSVAGESPASIGRQLGGTVGSQVTLVFKTPSGQTRQVVLHRLAMRPQAAPPAVTQPDGPPPAAPRNPLEPAGAAQPRSPAGGQVQPLPGRNGSGTVKLTRMSLRDPGLDNIEALTYLLPAGWKSEGSIRWNQQFSILVNILLRVVDPQSGAMMDRLPLQNFIWPHVQVTPMPQGGNYMGNIVMQPIEDPSAFVQMFYAPQALPHLRNLQPAGRTELPKVAAEVRRVWGAGTKVIATKLRYEYVLQRQPWEEDVFLTLVYTNGPASVMWSPFMAHSVRAPKGRLEAISPMMNLVVQSMQLTRDWYGGYRFCQNQFLAGQAAVIDGDRQRGEMLRNHQAEIRETFQRAHEDQIASSDRIAYRFGEYVGGVETYGNPFEQRNVYLPAGYRDAWVNAKGEYIINTEPGYDPNTGSTAEWRRMEKR